MTCVVQWVVLYNQQKIYKDMFTSPPVDSNIYFVGYIALPTGPRSSHVTAWFSEWVVIYKTNKRYVYESAN